ncbi:calcium-activated chloride channel regulator 1-like [Carassius carassius]|uniref:calcium-activated chloride channel regulator 1-like n=1 Tax=Carassius carassius TaxID=217509 RepID=UPI0028688834|nr:calcium-activated chloride channel regulator 1-like [Carassius carassius]
MIRVYRPTAPTHQPPPLDFTPAHAVYNKKGSGVAVHLYSRFMDSRTVFVLLWMLLLSTSTGIKLDGNGYVDIVIAISSKIPQDNRLIDEIKEMVTEGSFHLYDALYKKVYFREATILVPPHWNGTNFTKARTETFGKAKIRIDNANPAYGVEPYTYQYGECGAEGEFIHFTPEYLLNDTLIELCGSRGRIFVHEWAHLRWGVYDECNDRIEATRCSNNIKGQFHGVTAGQALQKCCIATQTSLPTKGCMFFLDRNQITNSSIMFSEGLNNVTAFCQENGHYYETPNMQNKKCGKATWSVIFEDSVDKDVLCSLKPLKSRPPPPSFKVVQRKQRVVCLILDVSGSMQGLRILQLQQAATHFLRNIIEDQASVGIVQFSTKASTLRNLTTIDSDTTRENLIKLLPKVADGTTNMCLGLSQGLQILREDNADALGDEIIFLTDGQATDNITDCVPSAIQSGAIIHTLAFGNKASHALTEMAKKTGGKFLSTNDKTTSNQLMDAFASLTLSTGDYTNEPVQLESIGARTSNWFNGTVSVDQTVGNKTSFVIIYEIRFPNVYIQSPSGSVYTQTNMSHDVSQKTVTLNIPGTAEHWDWKFSIQTTILQALTLTVTSQAAQADVPPIIVKTHMNQQFSDGTKPMIVFAEVSQNYRPVINAEVLSTLDSENGSIHQLQLLDNGAGADAFQDDGVYSRYFTQMVNGRSSLKVRVKNQDGHTRIDVLYVHGCVINEQLNPQKPPVSDEPLEVGNFTRTSTGESFEVKFSGTAPPNFPPNRITDLSAEIQEDTVLLNWTAPGEDLDQGTAKSYEIRWSFDLKMLRFNFSNGYSVNTTAVTPQKAGSVEQHSFNLKITIQKGTTLFFAVQTKDKQNAKSETSNIAQASKILPAPISSEISNPGMNLTVLVISLCVVFMLTLWSN